MGKQIFPLELLYSDRHPKNSKMSYGGSGFYAGGDTYAPAAYQYVGHGAGQYGLHERRGGGNMCCLFFLIPLIIFLSLLLIPLMYYLLHPSPMASAIQPMAPAPVASAPVAPQPVV